jgi:RNA polymerase sigma factor (sigma-70 family)
MVAPRFPIDLADPALRAALIRSLRQRVPPADIEDVVQATLVEAWAAPEDRRPVDAEGARRWLWGIARHKVADLHRRGRRERVALLGDAAEEPSADPSRATPDTMAGASNDSGERSEGARDANDLLRWAADQLPAGDDVPQTFEWLLREGDGDKLEQIAEEEALPAPRVRQRVSRLRKHFRSRWALEVAAVAVLLGLVFLAYRYLRGVRQAPEDERIVRETPTAPPSAPTPFELAEQLREATFPLCAAGDRERCLDGLDRAKKLDPAGEATPRVRSARDQVAPISPTPPSASASASPAPTVLPTAAPPRPTTPFPTGTTFPTATSAPPPPPAPARTSTRPRSTEDSFGSTAAPPIPKRPPVRSDSSMK